LRHRNVVAVGCRVALLKQKHRYYQKRNDPKPVVFWLEYGFKPVMLHFLFSLVPLTHNKTTLQISHVFTTKRLTPEQSVTATYVEL
ncbi:hypothetical protein, partial [Desulfonatronum sp. SC1]|uniref:hypothetical protein n=1 Tax=Desulfonatronum sp. SC1 TaxID=2109626 RepID=UPI001E37E917